MFIDSHHHFWKYNPAEYGWIDESMSAIRRDFLAEDLRQAIESAGVDGVISVHATAIFGRDAWAVEHRQRKPVRSRSRGMGAARLRPGET